MTFNTGNPIGSTDSRDRLDNTENMDYLENSTTELTHTDRLGTVRKTRHGMEVEHDAQIAAHESEHDAQMQAFESDFDGRLAGMAFTRVGSFTTGATLTDMRQVLVWEVSQGGDGHEYGWSGTFPKVVAAGSTPETSGGIGDDAWVGAAYSNQVDTVSIMTARNYKVGSVVQTKGYTTPGDGGGAFYLIKASGTNVISKADHTLANGNVAKLMLETNMDIRKIGAVNDGDFIAKTGTDNSTTFDALSLLAEEYGGISVNVEGVYRGVLFVNKSNVTIKGNGVIFSTSDIQRGGITFSVGPVDVKNLAPFKGQPWNYPSDIAEFATVWRCENGAFNGKTVATYSNDVAGGGAPNTKINVGDTCILIKGAHTISTPASNHVPEKFQHVKVEAVSGTTVTFNEELYTDFGDNANPDEAGYLVHWPTMLDGIDISGITIRNDYTGAVYLHRIAGIWEGKIDIETHSESGGGAVATCKKLFYGVNCQRGYNGISTGRMSEDIRIKSVIKVGRLQESGNDEGLGCFIEENPRNITFENLNIRGGVLRFYGLSEHSNIQGLVDVNGYDNRAMSFSTLETNATVNLRGRLNSDHPGGTVFSQFLAECNVHFDGDIGNSSTGVAWEHRSGTSSVKPRCRITSDSEFGDINYYDSIRTDLSRDKRLSRGDFSASSYATVTVSGGVPTKGLNVGRISTIRKDSDGFFSVNFSSSYSSADNYVLQVSARSAYARIHQKFTSKCEVSFTNASGVAVDPTIFDVVIFDKTEG